MQRRRSSEKSDELLYFVTDEGGSRLRGVVRGLNYHFISKQEALHSARWMWRTNMGKKRPFIHRVDAWTQGRRIHEAWEWKPTDDDFVWLMEKALITDDKKPVRRERFRE